MKISSVCRWLEIGRRSVGRQLSRLPIVFPTRKLLLGECSLKVNDRVTINRSVKLQCVCTMPTKLFVCRLCCSGDPTKKVFIRSSIEVWLTFRGKFGDGVKFIRTCLKFILHIFLNYIGYWCCFVYMLYQNSSLDYCRTDASNKISLNYFFGRNKLFNSINCLCSIPVYIWTDTF